MKGKTIQLVNQSINQTKLRLEISVCEHAIEIKKLGQRPTAATYHYDDLDKMQGRLSKLKTALKIAEHEDATNEHLFYVSLLDSQDRVEDLTKQLDKAKELGREYLNKIQEHRSRSEELEEKLEVRKRAIEELKAKLPVQPVGKVDLD